MSSDARSINGISGCMGHKPVAPSSRRYEWPCRLRKDSRTSSILVICVKMRQRWPPFLSLRSMPAMICSLPEGHKEDGWQ